jgi:hypothetical protein
MNVEQDAAAVRKPAPADNDPGILEQPELAADTRPADAERGRYGGRPSGLLGEERHDRQTSGIS